MMLRFSILSAGLVLLALHAAAASPDVGPTVAPIKRSIVLDLTSDLKRQLEKQNISLLLVIPGPQHHSSMKLDWGKVTDSVEKLNFVYNFEGFLSQWFGFFRYHRWHQLHGGSSHHRRDTEQLLRRDSILHLADPEDHPFLQPTPPRVAILVRANQGTVRSSQLNLAAAVSRRLRHAHALSFAYSTHLDKGDSLVTFDNEGVPLEASFLSTSVFRDAFTAIYDKNVWGKAGGGSGDGSTVPYTQVIRPALLDILKRYKINSMLDSSCGSMHWMPLVLTEAQKTNKDFRFMGTDVVCSLIARHQTTLAKEHPNWQFQCVDYSNQRLPSGYELIWSRDSLQHVPMHGAWQFLNNVKASGAKYLLVGSYVNSTSANGNINKPGDYYAIDLLKPPFKLPKPLEIIDERTPDGKHMLLYEVASLTWQDTLDGII